MILHYDGAKSQSCIVENFCTTGGQSLLSLRAQWKKAFLPTSNVIISQSVWSTFAKLFGHVLVVV
jgi:aspartate/tyrosine/aromatic aminotransferase